MQDERFVVDLYLRVSTERQVNEGDSLEEQENELRKFCEYRKFNIHRILIEKGRSGGNTNRPEYQRLIQDVKHRNINAIVVKKLDRLSRSLLDFENLMTQLRENEVEFISLKESFDTTSAMGKAMLRVALVFAQLEREQTSERLLDVLEYRAKKGIYNGGTRPYGYASVNKELVPYSKEKEVVETIYSKFVEGKSTSQIESILNLHGYRTRSNKQWDRRHIDYILRNPVYTGKLKWGGKYNQGIHIPIITEDVFNRVQEIFKSKGYQRQVKNVKGLLLGILYCRCGSEMKPNYTKKLSGKEYYYYRCATTMEARGDKQKCGNPYLAMDDADHRVIKTIREYATDIHLACIQKHVDDHNAIVTREIEAIEAKINALKKDLADIQQKKDTYLDTLITKEFSAKERTLINEKIDEFIQRDKENKIQIDSLGIDIKNKQKQMVSISELKAELLYFKASGHVLSDDKREEWIHKHIRRIIYYAHEHIEIQFKFLDEMQKRIDQP